MIPYKACALIPYRRQAADFIYAFGVICKAAILHPNTKVLEFQVLFVFLGVKNTPLLPLHLFLNLMDLNLRLYRTFEKSMLFWYNIVRKNESEDTQIKNGYTMVRRLKLTPLWDPSCNRSSQRQETHSEGSRHRQQRNLQSHTPPARRSWSLITYG